MAWWALGGGLATPPTSKKMCEPYRWVGVAWWREGADIAFTGKRKEVTSHAGWRALQIFWYAFIDYGAPIVTAWPLSSCSSWSLLEDSQLYKQLQERGQELLWSIEPGPLRGCLGSDI